ncbi:MAG: ferritin-like domain-containing protein [Opitutaceae bacterium]|nr:ferritin-like domain-containing protein [Opitutaceae bacterium]
MSTATLTPPSSGGRTAAVQEMARLQRELFELERAFISSATTLVPRVGEPDLKYLVCQHVWESAGHARFLRERGRELTGFGKTDSVRPAIWRVFAEAITPSDPDTLLAGFYRVLKPHVLASYRHYLEATHHLADWPSRKLVEEFIGDEERHAEEMEPHLNESVDTHAWCEHLSSAIATLHADGTADLTWQHEAAPYTHPATCNRGPYPLCSSVFSKNPDETPIVRDWLEDPTTDARVIRVMIYIWLMMELDAVDYLATVFVETLEAPFDLHHDLARHLWDESRHSQFGYRQLPKLGFDLMTIEHSLDLYNILVQMPPAERYALMTMEFEAGSFATKATIMDRIRELNDFEADTLLAFDRNDEQNHVRYGHQWLPEIMKLCGHEESVEDFVKSAQTNFAKMAEIHGNKTPHSLSPEQRLTGAKILAAVTRGSGSA